MEGLQGHKHQITSQPCCPCPRPSAGQVFPSTERAGSNAEPTAASSGGERKCTIFQAHQGRDPPLNWSRAIREEAVLEQSVDSHHPLGTFLGRSSHPLFPFMKYFWFLVKKGCHDNLTASAWSWLSLQGLTGRLQCTKAPIIYLLILTFCGQGLE